jgi:hypothetical protein
MIGYRVEKVLIFMRFRGPEALNDKPEIDLIREGLPTIWPEFEAV